jgi:NDP-sugar pyrophosphorylase family protein
VSSIQAVILCGGLGSRLRPLTYSIPKPLLPVGGKPIITHILDRLCAAGLTEVALATGFRSELIEEQVGDRYRTARIQYFREPVPLGTAGALNLVRGLTADPFVVTNGDLLTDLNLLAMIDVHKQEGAEMTVAVRSIPVGVPYGVVEMSSRRLTGIREKPEIDVRINAGVYVLSSSVWEILPEGAYQLPDLATACLARGGVVAGHVFDDYWIDIGAMPDYLRANEDIARATGVAVDG